MASLTVSARRMRDPCLPIPQPATITQRDNLRTELRDVWCGNFGRLGGHYTVMSNFSDRDLWSRALTSDKNAFGELFERHASSVYNFLFRRCANWTTAEDLTSIVFLEAWRKRDRVDLVHDSALPWLLGVATNVMRNQRRAERRYRDALRRVVPAPDTPDLAEDLVQRVSDEFKMKFVLEAFGRLPQREQDVIALCLWSGLTYEEAATSLNLPVGTVRSRLSRGRRRLRELLCACGHNMTECTRAQAGQGVVP